MNTENTENTEIFIETILTLFTFQQNTYYFPLFPLLLHREKYKKLFTVRANRKKQTKANNKKGAMKSPFVKYFNYCYRHIYLFSNSPSDIRRYIIPSIKAIIPGMPVHEKSMYKIPCPVFPK